MRKAGFQLNGNPRFRCAVKARRQQSTETYRAWQNQYKRERAEDGFCCDCGQPKLSEWYCWECLNKEQFRGIEKEAREWLDCPTTLSETHNTRLVALSE